MFVMVIIAEGCPADCTAHGACVKIGEEYSCSCEDGWKGLACDVMYNLNWNVVMDWIMTTVCVMFCADIIILEDHVQIQNWYKQ